MSARCRLTDGLAAGLAARLYGSAITRNPKTGNYITPEITQVKGGLHWAAVTSHTITAIGTAIKRTHTVVERELVATQPSACVPSLTEEVHERTLAACCALGQTAPHEFQLNVIGQLLQQRGTHF
jgi:hypothetical protein